MLKFDKRTPDFGSLANEGLKQSYFKALKSLIPCDLSTNVDYTNINKVSFKLLSDGDLFIAYRKNNELDFKLGIWSHGFNLLFWETIKPVVHQDGFQLVELNRAIFLCFFESEARANASKNSSIMKFDSNLKLQKNIIFEFVIINADSYQNKLYLLATRLNRKSKHIYVLDESLTMLENIQLGNGEGLPFFVPNSVSKMRVAENFFLFLDGTKVMLMDRLDGAIKRTIRISSSDFVLDSSNDRILTHDGETEKLVCFDFQGESFEISCIPLKKF